MDGVKQVMEKVANTEALKPKFRFREICIICQAVSEYDYPRDSLVSSWYIDNKTICSRACYDKYKEIEDKKYYSQKIREIPIKFRELEYDQKTVKDNYGLNLFISGGQGIGKTTLASSIAKEAIKNKKSFKWINYPAFIMELQNSFRNDKESPFSIADEVANFDGLLIIDDFGCEKMSDWVRQISYFIINEREQRELSIIITSNFSLEEIAQQIDTRISSRIAGMCKALKLSGKDKRLDNQDKKWKIGEAKSFVLNKWL